ncbi:MAG: NAD(P)/FAD-dependent oxidoreductase [Gammaproteobacteria bacterium]|nr:NAD(P)/FAD-dependent oxidoreductase [Gammaproteobacteria bacterium]
MQQTDVIIIGASASGLMCAIEAGKRGRKVTVLDHSNKVGKKILMSGGGRCNFTNYSVSAENYISHNPHFCKSALSRYTQWDFMELVKSHGIKFHEKSHGQLFCDHSAKDIVSMLLAECDRSGVSVHVNTSIDAVNKGPGQQFMVSSSMGNIQCEALVVATGGLSVPTLGASAFGYKLAEQFDIKVWPTSAALVPFTLQPEDKSKFSVLSGVAVDSIVSDATKSFRENILFTHRGLSGPAILQLSSYWRPGRTIQIDLLPDVDLFYELKSTKNRQPNTHLKTALLKYLPKRLVSLFLGQEFAESVLHGLNESEIKHIASLFKQWMIKPNGTEGYRTAEVTLGGVDCDALSSKTMECNNVSGLYFIGEVVDVTGWLGGYNFQWAWSSAWCAGQYV